MSIKENENGTYTMQYHLSVKKNDMKLSGKWGEVDWQCGSCCQDLSLVSGTTMVRESTAKS